VLASFSEQVLAKRSWASRR